MSKRKEIKKRNEENKALGWRFQGEECRRLMKMMKWRRESPFIALEKALEWLALIKRSWKSKVDALETCTLNALEKDCIFAADTWRYSRT
jgi:hypothetical protein